MTQKKQTHMDSLARITLAGTIAFFVSSAPAPAANYFVAPGGADTNPGTVEQPFATLSRAQQVARQAKGREPVTVNLREGVYYLPGTLIFTAEDSGTAAAPLRYQAYQKEPVVISGGVRLRDLKWGPYRDGIMKASVPTGFATDQLFVNGERQPLARYPNFDPSVRHFNGYAADAISPQRAAKWKDPRGGFIHAMHSAEWGGMHYVITGKGPDNQITYEGGWQNNRPSGMHPRLRMVENIFEELDAPGEWFLDSAAATLYFYPPSGLDLSTATIEAVRLRHLVEFRGNAQAPVRFLTLHGLTFRHAARTFMENKEPLVRSDWTTYRGGALFYTGTEDCWLEDCFIDQVGGNAVFVNNYNRRLTVRGCQIAKAGGNGVAFVGDRDAARVPRDWKDRSQNLANLDRTPGPKSDNYPGDCLVDDCLIYLSGRVEKQTAPVQIELCQGITVRHCSLYDVPRAGINIGDGCWGGHVIEFCDIFDTVKETGDHGSFNSWGRDRFWDLGGLNLNDDKTWEAEKNLPLLDAVKTVVLRNNRWRCDHGWDIDLDDGSSNYELRNNLCLNGGIKNREGFYRVVENNIMVNNGFHPHVWFKHSQDVFRRNIMWMDHYLPAGGMPPTPWGKEMDYNLIHRPELAEPTPAAYLAGQSKRDANSILADAMFVDPARGDFRVREGSPALKLGFVNFPMDQFGVQKPELKAIARTPALPKLTLPENALFTRSVVSVGDSARLQRALAKARRGEAVTVGVIGGSITQGAAASEPEKRYGNLVAAWWRRTFPNSKIQFVNAGIGATGSDYGALRASRDLLSRHPDMVIVEYAVNDPNTQAASETLEGLVRQILRQTNQPAVVLLFTMDQNGHNAQEWHGRVGRHYGLPMISFRDALWPEIQQGRLKWSDVEADAVHPNDRGHDYCARFITQQLEKLLRDLPADARLALPPPLAQPLLSDAFEHVALFEADALKPLKNQGWSLDAATPGNRGWKADQPGSTIEFEVEGQTVLIMDWHIRGPMGQARVQVDDLPPVVRDGWFDQTWGGYRQTTELARQLKTGKHRVRIELLPEKNPQSNGHEFRLLGLGTAGVEADGRP